MGCLFGCSTAGERGWESVGYCVGKLWVIVWEAAETGEQTGHAF